MDLDFDKLSKEELLQLFLESESKVRTQEKELQNKESIIKNSEAELLDKSSEVKWLTHQLAQLRRMIFGSKSERFEEDTNQMKIEFEEYASDQEKQYETTVKETITYERENKSKKHNGRNRLPKILK